MVIYPRVIEVIFNFLKEKGLIIDFKYSDVFAYMVVTTILVYNWFFEPGNIPASYNRAVNTYSQLTKEEIMLKSVFRGRVDKIIHKFKNNVKW